MRGFAKVIATSVDLEYACRPRTHSQTSREDSNDATGAEFELNRIRFAHQRCIRTPRMTCLGDLE